MASYPLGVTIRPFLDARCLLVDIFTHMDLPYLILNQQSRKSGFIVLMITKNFVFSYVVRLKTAILSSFPPIYDLEKKHNKIVLMYMQATFLHQK